MTDEADVSEVMDPVEQSEVSDEMDDEELVLCMKAGRGGKRDPSTSDPCSSTRISRFDVSASDDNLS